MCGIFALITDNVSHSQLKNKEYINEAFMLGQGRGPESSELVFLDNKDGSNELDVTFGFHRLAINGLDIISMQPISLFNKILICNLAIILHKFV